ncbi:hypothetical protein D5086_025850 [Populus alba]|uniref:DUF4378 domain-containing protein n=3 Tax=Populus TaxID=3689 RepID=A0A4U5QUA6_POPAL|nr:uncharacterized protein LOC118041927 [Populus alba]KAJ6972230.1 hypothetical protein NC653_032722 [Populus alba x Populus x berolinensis]TKS14590.1 uncharacterized protein D5086_0000046640 [Populus alba]
MGSLYNSCSSTNFKQRNHVSTEHRPKLLKDFLIDDDSNSCCSSGFRSFSRKPCDSTMKTLIEIDLRNPKRIANSGNKIASYKLLRSRSKAAASTTISAFQAVINAVKNIHFTAVKPPSILPRSLSRKLSKKKSQNKENEVKITVTVKDIIRWRSFRDMVEEKSLPSDLPSSPYHCITTTTGSTSTTPRSGSSWCDSDFTSDYLPHWNGNFDESGEKEIEVGKKNSPCVGEDSLETITNTKVGPEEDEEERLHSPAVSATEFEFEEDEVSSSSFEQSLATVERTREKIMENIRRFESLTRLDNLGNWMSIDENISSGDDDDNEEDDDDLEGIRETNMNSEGEEEEEEEIHEVEERAWKLLNHVKETGLECCSDNMDLLFDFFRDELATRTYENSKQRIDVELLKKAKAWINGEDSFWVQWELEHKREVYVRDMDREGRWSKFEEEQQELALGTENGVLDLLVDDLLLDLISY